MNVVGGDGENGLPEKMTCMEDSKWAIAVRAVAVYIYGSGSFGTNKPILVKWRWNTLTQRVLQVVPGTTKSPVSGGETPSPPAEEKDPHNGGKKALCSPYITFWARCRSRGSWLENGMPPEGLVRSMGPTSRHVACQKRRIFKVACRTPLGEGKV